MSTTQIITPPTNKVGFNTQVPLGLYLCRWKAALKHVSAKRTNMIRMTYEIIHPDFVPDPNGTPLFNEDNTPVLDENGNQAVSSIQVAGRSGDAYFSVDPTDERGLTATFNAFQKLGLLTEDGNIDVDRVLAAINPGRRYFYATLDSEEDIKRFPPKRLPNGEMQKVGDPIPGPDGKEIKNGWRLKLLNDRDIVSATEPPPGLPEPAPF